MATPLMGVPLPSINNDYSSNGPADGIGLQMVGWWSQRTSHGQTLTAQILRVWHLEDVLLGRWADYSLVLCASAVVMSVALGVAL